MSPWPSIFLYNYYPLWRFLGAVMRGNSHVAAERRPRRKTVFLEALVDTVNGILACRRAGIARRTAYDWREADAGFARKWDDAVDEGVDLLEAELHKRAFEGVERPDTVSDVSGL